MYVVKLIITILKEHIFPLEYFNSVLQINLTLLVEETKD